MRSCAPFPIIAANSGYILLLSEIIGKGASFHLMVGMMTARCIAAVVRRIFDLIFTIDIDTDDLIGVCVAHVAIVGVDHRIIVA